MTINTTTLEASLQTKLNATTGTTDGKEFLLLGKALEAVTPTVAVSNVTSEGTTQVGLVTTAGTTQVGLVNTAGTTKLGIVNTAGTTQVGLVNAAGTTQIAAVQAIAPSMLVTGDVGVSVQAYDADTSKLDVAETRSASSNFADNVLQRPEIKDYSETIQAMAANDVDCSLGNVQTKSISGSVTLTFSNPPTSGKAGAFTLITTLSSSPVITWPSSVKWAEGTAPDLTAAGIDIFTFMTTDGGSNWYGFTSGADMQ